jgi:hypothetical protein
MAFIALGTAAVGAGAAIYQGVKASNAQKRAQKEANKRAEEAKRRIQTNYAEGVRDIPTEVYDQQYQQQLAAQQQAMTGLQESGQRAVLGGAGGLQANTMAQQEQTRMEKQNKLYERDIRIQNEAESDSLAMAGINLKEAEGAQIRAQEQENIKNQATMSAVNSIGTGLLGAYAQSDLYDGDKSAAMAIINKGGETVNDLRDQYKNQLNK